MAVKMGQCPICGNNLEYGAGEVTDNEMYFYWVTCQNKKCSFYGKEWYTMCFVGFNDSEGKEYNLDS